jgi:hypothetical protein
MSLTLREVNMFLKTSMKRRNNDNVFEAKIHGLEVNVPLDEDEMEQELPDELSPADQLAVDSAMSRKQEEVKRRYQQEV